MNTTAIPAHMTEIGITAPGGPQVLVTRQVPTPVAGPGELLVRVEAAGVNRPDVLQRLGVYPVPAGANPTPGLEIAGEVIAIGSHEVGGFQIGDKVCGLTNGGGYAQICALPAAQTLPWPKGLSAIEAAAIPETFFTVWANLFMMGQVKAGDSVLIHGGTSGIGTTALLLAREFGLRAFATAGSPQKCNAMLELGAQAAINHREQDFAPAILQHTQGRGVDAILDIMGAAYFDKNLASLAMDGRLLMIGFLGGVMASNVNLMSITMKRLVITGSTLRARTTAEKQAIAQQLLTKVWPALEAGRCIPIIHSTFALEQAADAHRLMESSEHIGKIVLRVSQADQASS